MRAFQQPPQRLVQSIPSVQGRGLESLGDAGKENDLNLRLPRQLLQCRGQRLALDTYYIAPLLDGRSVDPRCGAVEVERQQAEQEMSLHAAALVSRVDPSTAPAT